MTYIDINMFFFQTPSYHFTVFFLLQLASMIVTIGIKYTAYEENIDSAEVMIIFVSYELSHNTTASIWSVIRCKHLYYLTD